MLAARIVTMNDQHLLLLLLIVTSTIGFQPRTPTIRDILRVGSINKEVNFATRLAKRQPSYALKLATLDVAEDGQTSPNNKDSSQCFWKDPSTGRWEARISFKDLKVGQQLSGTLFQELVEGKTGPKLFFDCGVSRLRNATDWEIVTGMCRLTDRKQSAVVKRVARLRKKSSVDLWVSRIFPRNLRFEVVLRPEDVPKSPREFTSASVLQPNQELVGTVVRLEPFGVFLDVGANREGLLHIQRVADLFGHYIDKKQGLVEAGLERGAKIRVSVLSNERKRLFLDFTADVKAVAVMERDIQKQEKEKAAKSSSTSPKLNVSPSTAPVMSKSSTDSVGSTSISEEEAAAWAAYAAESAAGHSEEEEDDEGYDEDREIEDALGIGMY